LYSYIFFFASNKYDSGMMAYRVRQSRNSNFQMARAAHAAHVLFHTWHRRRHASVSSCNCNATRNTGPGRKAGMQKKRTAATE